MSNGNVFDFARKAAPAAKPAAQIIPIKSVASDEAVQQAKSVITLAMGVLCKELGPAAAIRHLESELSAIGGPDTRTASALRLIAGSWEEQPDQIFSRAEAGVLLRSIADVYAKGLEYVG